MENTQNAPLQSVFIYAIVCVMKKQTFPERMPEDEQQTGIMKVRTNSLCMDLLRTLAVVENSPTVEYNCKAAHDKQVRLNIG